MDLYEYQARDLFEKYGVPVLDGIRSRHPERLRRRQPKRLGGGVVVVKAQVKMGGRGKAGGVKVAKNLTRRTLAPRTSWVSTSRATSPKR